MAPMHRLDEALLRPLLMGGEEEGGIFSEVLGFATGTGVIKGVHLMNDLAQSALGGVPAHKGDLLCQVIREDHPEEKTGDALLRADKRLGAVYQRAFPSALGLTKISALREALGAVINADAGMYQAGTEMASGLVTHRDLLGGEGFRRFRLGAYLVRLVGEEGAAQLRALYLDDRDPYARLFAPLRWELPLNEKYGPLDETRPLLPFEQALGRRLGQLLKHPLTKPQRLRLFLLASTLGIVLRFLGAGQPDGRPAALACADVAGPHARSEAAQAYARGMDGLNRRFAEVLERHPRWPEVLKSRPGKKDAALEVDGPLDATTVLQAARKHNWAKEVYWPENFAVALGRKAGCVQPKKDNAGWPKRLVLTPDLIEALILMYTEPGGAPVEWRSLWAEVEAELGLMVGVNLAREQQRLHAVDVKHVNLDALAKNAEDILNLALHRGVARRLPDSGAEAGGELT